MKSLRLSPKLRLLVLLSATGLAGAAVVCGVRRASGDGRLDPFSVVITESIHGEPVVGLEVEAVREDGERLETRSTDLSGRVVWEPGVSGRVTVRVADPEARFIDAIAEADGDAECQISVRPGVAVDLLVGTRSGEVRDCVLELWTADGSRGRRWQAQAIVVGDSVLHQVHLAPVAPGPAKIFVLASGFETRVLDVTIPEHGGDLGRVDIEPGGSVLRGRIDPRLGVRATRAFFRFAGAGIGVDVASGRFEFGGLPSGRGTLVLLDGDRELFSREVDVDRPILNLGAVRPGA